MNEHKLLSSKAVRELFGISAMSLWRWTRNIPDFPKPLVIRSRRYWRSDELKVWCDRAQRTTAETREAS